MTPNPTGRLVERLTVASGYFANTWGFSIPAGESDDIAALLSEAADRIEALEGERDEAEKALQTIAWEGAESATSKQILAACRDTAREALAELEREREEQGSSNASRAATGPAARIASVVEPSADLEALHIKAFIEQGRKQQAARLAGQPFRDWLRALAKIADPDDPAGWLVGCVVLNEDCWFDYFADGCTPASCWAEQCSYD